MKIFFDTEFTGLHQHTTLISIGLVADNGRKFYAEFTDYDKSQINEWLEENVISNLIYNSGEDWIYTDGEHTRREGDTIYIGQELEKWFFSLGVDKIEMWSDGLAYDWVLFNQLWKQNWVWWGPYNIPEMIYYIPFDLATVFKIKGIDPDINREEFSGLVEGQNKHNALWDAEVIKACYEKLIEEE